MVVIALPEEMAPGDQSGYLSTDVFSEDNTSPYYITAAWDEEKIYNDSVPSVFTVGEGRESVYKATPPPPDMTGKVSYRNVPLKSSTSYSIFVRYDIASDVGPEVRAPCVVYYQTRC